MNLICCNENCIHQKDGYCILDNPSTIYVASNDCCYFKDAEKNKTSVDL